MVRWEKRGNTKHTFTHTHTKSAHPTVRNENSASSGHRGFGAVCCHILAPHVEKRGVTLSHPFFLTQHWTFRKQRGPAYIPSRRRQVLTILVFFFCSLTFQFLQHQVGTPLWRLRRTVCMFALISIFNLSAVAERKFEERRTTNFIGGFAFSCLEMLPHKKKPAARYATFLWVCFFSPLSVEPRLPR